VIKQAGQALRFLRPTRLSLASLSFAQILVQPVQVHQQRAMGLS
jgi:hypothetical protein